MWRVSPPSSSLRVTTAPSTWSGVCWFNAWTWPMQASTPAPATSTPTTRYWPDTVFTSSPTAACTQPATSRTTAPTIQVLWSSGRLAQQGQVLLGSLAIQDPITHLLHCQDTGTHGWSSILSSFLWGTTKTCTWWGPTVWAWTSTASSCGTEKSAGSRNSARWSWSRRAGKPGWGGTTPLRFPSSLLENTQRLRMENSSCTWQKQRKTYTKGICRHQLYLISKTETRSNLYLLIFRRCRNWTRNVEKMYLSLNLYQQCSLSGT